MKCAVETSIEQIKAFCLEGFLLDDEKQTPAGRVKVH